MSAAVIGALLRADLSPVSVKMMALVVAWHYNDEEGRAWASLGTMARECGLSERHAKRALAALKAMGVLVVLRVTPGGDRYASTTHYGFDLQVLARRSNPVRPRTGGAGARGAAVEGKRDNSHAAEAAPSAPAALDPVRRRPSPSAPVAPKRDERKPTASSSSKAPAAPDSADGRSAGTGNTSASGKVVQMSTMRQQPAFEENAVRLRNLAPAVKEDPKVWMNNDASLSSIGCRFGLNTLASTLAQGSTRVDYIRKVLNLRAAALKEIKAAGIERGAASGPAVATGRQ